MGCRYYDPLQTSLYCIKCLNKRKQKTMTIKIYSIPDVSIFVTKAIKIEDDITITQGRYVINGKSLMGVFSLDLTQEIVVEYPSHATEFEEFIKNFKAE